MNLFNKAIKICKQNNYTQKLPYIYNNQALIYKKTGNLDSALYLNKKALTYKDLISIDLQATFQNNLGTLYMEFDQLEKARTKLMHALEIYRSMKSLRKISATYSNLGKLFTRKQQYKNAEQYLDSALNYAQKAKSFQHQKKAYHNYAILYENQQNYDKALTFYEKYSTLVDSLKKEEHLTRISEMEKNIKLQKEKQTREALNKQNAAQKLRIAKAKQKRKIFFVIVIILGIIILFFIYKYFMDHNKKKKLEEKKQQYKDALDELSKSKNKNDSLLKAIPDLLFLFDQNGYFLEIRTQNEEKLTLSKTQLLNSSISDILPDKESKKFTDAIPKVLKHNTLEIFKYEQTIRNIYHIFEARLVALDKNKVLCLSRDVTEESENLTKLEESKQALKESNIAKDKFFSIIAHDLKNPFNALIGFSSLLNSDYDEFTDEEKQEYIKQIYQASDSLFGLLENLLEWTRTQTGKIEFTPEPVYFKNIIDKNVDILNPEARQKNISIDVKQNDAMHETVYADKNMLTSIIRNLTANAKKYTHSGGRVTIQTDIENDMLKCFVIDNGLGMPEEVQKNLFRIDSDIKKTGTHNEQGTGLGLLLCKEFVENQKGSIGVESKEGEGSTFYFTVPLYRP